MLHLCYRCLAFGLAPSPPNLMQSSSATVVNPLSSTQASLFCTECYYKPGSCSNDHGSPPVRHLGTPLPSSPNSGTLLENMNVASPSNSLARSIAQHQEEMSYRNLEVMNKSLRNNERSIHSPSQSASLRHTDILATKDNTRPELQLV